MKKKKAIFDILVKDDSGEWSKTLVADRISVGRLPDCGLVINSVKVSRHHFSLFVSNDKIWIEDLGSSNGTRVNGISITSGQPFALPSESVVEMGRSNIYMRIQSRFEPGPDLKGPPKPVEESITRNLNIEEPPKVPHVQQVQQSENINTRAVDTANAEAISAARAKAEATIQEAKAQAIRILQEAQVEAERKALEIHRHAQETQTKAENFYKEKMQLAMQDSELLYKETEKSNQELLQQARAQSNEFRTAAETYARELRSRAEDQTALFLKEADEQARQLKENRVREFEEQIRAKEAQLLLNAHMAAEAEVAKVQENLRQQGAQQIERLAREEEIHTQKLAADLKAHQDRVSLVTQELSRLDEIHQKKSGELHSLNQSIQKHSAELRGLNEQIKQATTSLKALEQKNAELTATHAQEFERLGKLQADVKKKTEESGNVASALSKLNRDFEETEKAQQARLLQMRAKYDQDFERIKKVEEERIHQLNLESTRRAQNFEEDIFVEIADKKKKIGREILLTIEAALKDEADLKKTLNSATLEKNVFDILGGGSTSVSTDSAAQEKRKQLLNEKRKDRFVLLGSGIMAGALLFFGSESVYRQVSGESSPWQRHIASAIAENKRELEERRFRPAQNDEIRDTYADSVIYTQGFADTYTGDDFQEHWSKAAVQYLFKTWRLDETKSIEALSVTRAMVKGLNERRQNIHPDFVPQGIEKMQEFEKENVSRLKEILGSQVRYESLKKFEKQYFEDYMKKETTRAAASVPEK